jgi:hypothetical protein
LLTPKPVLHNFDYVVFGVGKEFNDARLALRLELESGQESVGEVKRVCDALFFPTRKFSIYIFKYIVMFNDGYKTLPIKMSFELGRYGHSNIL